MYKVDNVLTNELCALQVGGLDSVVSDASGGWENIVVRIAPTAIVTVGGASNRHETRFGTVSVSWRYKDGQLTMELAVPIGSIAQVHTPLIAGGRNLLSISEGTSQLWAVTAIQPQDMTGSEVNSVETRDSAVVATVGSGVWRFVAMYQ